MSLRFDTGAVSLLRDYSWPGNVRELENVIERLANNTMKTGVVSAGDVKIDLKHNGWGEHDDEPREIILSKGLKCLNEGSVAVRHLSRRDELELYLKALDESEGDLSKAARRLGIKRTTLYMRIKRMQHNLGRDAIT